MLCGLLPLTLTCAHLGVRWLILQILLYNIGELVLNNVCLVFLQIWTTFACCTFTIAPLCIPCILTTFLICWFYK